MDDLDTRTWSHAILELVEQALDRNAAQITVEDANGIRSDHVLDMTALGADFSEEDTLEAIGIEPWRLEVPAVVGAVAEGSAADEAGLFPGDRITRINGEEVANWTCFGIIVV